VPLRFFGSRAFSAGNAANFLLNASIIGTVFFMAQFLQTAQGYGPLGAGVRLLPWTATLFVVAPIAGSLVNRVGERPLIVGGLALQAVGMAWVGLIASPSLPYAALVTPLIVMGAGVSLAIAPTENAVISAVAANDIGKASGTFNMVARLGAAFGVAILAAIFGSAGSVHSPQTFSYGFAAALRVAAALSLLGACAGLVLPGRGKTFVAPAQAEAQRIGKQEVSGAGTLP
jgi:MFS family permease